MCTSKLRSTKEEARTQHQRKKRVSLSESPRPQKHTHKRAWHDLRTAARNCCRGGPSVDDLNLNLWQTKVVLEKLHSCCCCAVCWCVSTAAMLSPYILIYIYTATRCSLFSHTRFGRRANLLSMQTCYNQKLYYKIYGNMCLGLSSSVPHMLKTLFVPTSTEQTTASYSSPS